MVSDSSRRFFAHSLEKTCSEHWEPLFTLLDGSADPALEEPNCRTLVPKHHSQFDLAEEIRSLKIQNQHSQPPHHTPRPTFFLLKKVNQTNFISYDNCAFIAQISDCYSKGNS